MVEEIEVALKPLIGMPLWQAHRALDMQCFHFGQQRLVPNRKNEVAIVGDFALHVQCTWRLTRLGTIITARRDLYYPASEVAHDDGEDFDYEQIPNRRDARLAEYFSCNSETPPRVVNYRVDRVGGFSLMLGADHTLDVFPDDSLDGEHWRLFRPGSSQRHLVVEGSRITRS